MYIKIMIIEQLCLFNKLCLFSAALAQSIEVVELLVLKRANVKARDHDGRTPLHGAIVRGARACDVARLLLSVGANPNAPDNFGYTPLHIAALNEFSACVLLLLGKLSQ
jgi:ankyrin repeat protein